MGAAILAAFLMKGKEAPAVGTGSETGTAGPIATDAALPVH